MAARGEATLVVKLVDSASAGLKGLKTGLNALKQNWLQMTAAATAAVAFMSSSIKAFAEQESAVSKLNQALKQQGIAGGSVSKELQAYASELQKTTGFADEQIIASEALTSSYGFNIQETKKLTQAAADLAVRFDMDLRTATIMVAKAATGSTDQLGRFGIKLKETSDPAQRFADTMNAIANVAGGAAKAQIGTMGGQLNQLSLAFNDLQERIGGEAVPVLQTWVRWMNKGIEVANNFFGIAKEDASVREIALQKLVKERDAIQELVKQKNASVVDGRGVMAHVANEIRQKTDLINKLRDQIAEEGKLSEVKSGKGRRSPIDEEADQKKKKELAEMQESIDLHGFELAEKARMEIESLTMTGDQRAELKAEQLAQELEMDNQFEAAKELREASANDSRKKRNTDAAQATMNSLNALATLQKAKSKEMAAVGKSAAIATATIDTIVSALAARKSLSGIPIIGPALGMAAFAAFIASGMAQVSAIRGTPLAEGGIIMPRAGGIQATIGEGGQAEAVIPLGDGRAQRQIRETMGGGGANITINAGVVVADKTSVAEFVEMIEQELFRRSRNGKSILDLS